MGKVICGIRCVLFSLLLGFLAIPWAAWGEGLILVAEVGQAQRDFNLGDFHEKSDEYQVLTGMVGFEFENSLLYVSYRTEDTSFIEGLLPYERREATVEWHWNEATEKDSYLAVTLGLFNTSYSFGSEVDEDFFGLALGVGGTRDLIGQRLFLVGSFKIKLPYTSRYLLGPSGHVCPSSWLS
jgi:hypothetical protein